MTYIYYEIYITSLRTIQYDVVSLRSLSSAAVSRPYRRAWSRDYEHSMSCVSCRQQSDCWFHGCAWAAMCTGDAFSVLCI